MNEHTINEPKNGFTFNWLNLFLGAAICYMMTNGAITDDWTFYTSWAMSSWASLSGAPSRRCRCSYSPS